MLACETVGRGVACTDWSTGWPGDSRIPPGRPSRTRGPPWEGRLERLPLYDFPGELPDYHLCSHKFLGFLKISYVLIDLVLVHVPCVVPLDY